MFSAGDKIKIFNITGYIEMEKNLFIYQSASQSSSFSFIYIGIKIFRLFIIVIFFIIIYPISLKELFSFLFLEILYHHICITINAIIVKKEKKHYLMNN